MVIKRFENIFKGFFKKFLKDHALKHKFGTKAKLDLATLKKMVYGIIHTQTDEISCDECFEQLGQFAELVLAGKKASEAIPLVQNHLDRCSDCREEFEALLAALRALI